MEENRKDREQEKSQILIMTKYPLDPFRKFLKEK